MYICKMCRTVHVVQTHLLFSTLATITEPAPDIWDRNTNLVSSSTTQECETLATMRHIVTKKLFYISRC
jgi:hypothetical protein